MHDIQPIGGRDRGRARERGHEHRGGCDQRPPFKARSCSTHTDRKPPPEPIGRVDGGTRPSLAEVLRGAPRPQPGRRGAGGAVAEKSSRVRGRSLPPTANLRTTRAALAAPAMGAKPGAPTAPSAGREPCSRGGRPSPRAEGPEPSRGRSEANPSRTVKPSQQGSRPARSDHMRGLAGAPRFSPSDALASQRRGPGVQPEDAAGGHTSSRTRLGVHSHLDGSPYGR